VVRAEGDSGACHGHGVYLLFYHDDGGGGGDDGRGWGEDAVDVSGVGGGDGGVGANAGGGDGDGGLRVPWIYCWAF
jgi:hypothetical protein